MPNGVVSKRRVAAGLCPRCGAEAAPYYLCHGCRKKDRLKRCLKKGVKAGALLSTGAGADETFSVNPAATDAMHRAWEKNGTPLDLDETDRRSHPRMRGVRVDVEAMLIDIIRVANRPVKIEEIMSAWGSLRTKRDAPLAHDLGRIIAATDKRERRATRLRALAAK